MEESESATASSHDIFWAAVVARDRREDGRFVYAVRTTGIYCRPSCPSRAAHRRNVSFFLDPDAAEHAGFRACRRCHPRDLLASAEVAVARARGYLDEHTDRTPTLAELARIAGLSAHHLQRTFKRFVGVSPKQYSAALRVERLKTHLRSGSTVSRATYEAGYGASSRAYHDASARLGMTPAAYRRGGAGVVVRFATTPSDLGRLLVAATPRGVCAVFLGDSDEGLAQALGEEYPRATLQRIDLAATEHSDFDQWLTSVAAYFYEGRDACDVPTDSGGTAFQQRVWRELQRIPFGETQSYSDVARAIGAPRSARAVASACARNRVALVIPCHRVVRENGPLGGYRWGPDRKKALVVHERDRAARAKAEASIAVREVGTTGRVLR